MKRAVLTLCAAAFAATTVGTAADAQSDYPSKPVRMIVDSAPGSATDVTARVIADRLSAIVKQPVVVNNHPGAGGSIAARLASQADPDGYTIYLGAASVFMALAGAPGVAPNLPVTLPRDFMPIGFVTQIPMFIAASPKAGIKSMPQLIERAKAAPGKLSYATTGRGRITHLTMEMVQMRAGIQLQMVPYTGGPSAALADLIEGRVDLVLDGYSSLAPGLKGGKLVPLANASTKRLPEFPDMPTVSETIPDFFAGGWNALLAPLGTPEAITRKLSEDLRTALSDKGVQAKLAATGAYVDPMTPEELTAFINEQQKSWKPVLEKVAKEAAAAGVKGGAAAKGKK